MGREASINYWVFSNMSEGEYDDSIWDMSAILKTKKYSIKEKEKNRHKVYAGDKVYMRIYGQNYIGSFIVGSEWKAAPINEQKEKIIVGTFDMEKVDVWKRPVPQNLIFGELSNNNYRIRIINIQRDDSLRIETVKRTYEKLGYGDADGKILVLEEGLEEAIKPNLKQLGLKLAKKEIQQQFSMGPGVGRSDLICVDDKGDLVVIELKRGKTSDETIGQVLRYVGWIKENIAEKNQKVHGMVITGDYDEQLRLAASAANIKIMLARLG